MRTFATFTDDDWKGYKAGMAEVVQSLLPPDGRFVLVFIEQQKAHYVSNGDRTGIPEAMRQLADAIEHDSQRGN